MSEDVICRCHVWIFTIKKQGFFYETVAPILSVGNSSLVAISTLTSEINFYTRLIKSTCLGDNLIVNI